MNNEKIKLYIDFDGVILDTIDKSYQILKNSKIKLSNSNHKAIEEFYQKLDWTDLVKKSKPINNSIYYLRKIISSNLYDTTILTHVNSDEEIKVKQDYLSKKIPGIDIVFVNKKYKKCDVVKCRNAILVDDFNSNLKFWQEKGGIPIKFSTKNKTYPYISISNLGMLIARYDELKEIQGKYKIKN